MNRNDKRPRSDAIHGTVTVRVARQRNAFTFNDCDGAGLSPFAGHLAHAISTNPCVLY